MVCGLFLFPHLVLALKSLPYRNKSCNFAADFEISLFMTKLLLTALAIFLFGVAAFAQSEGNEKTQLTTSQLTSDYRYATQSRGTGASIHDPSVVWDPTTQYFYIYGSHYVGAKTRDFKSYTTISNYYQGGYSDNVWTGTYNTYKAFQSCPTHTVKRCLPGSTTQEDVTLGSFDAGAFASIYADNVGSWVSGCQWAPDIIYNPHMGKWCLYLSINGDHWASVVVLLTSDNPTGPFTYEAPIVFGGFDGQTRTGKSVNYKDTDLEIVLGAQTSLPSRYRTNAWGSYYPNCIDPCSFFDEDGELWLAYGSWSGGIFMLKLDKNTGLRDYTCTYGGTGTSPNANATSDAYFGKKIAGGYYVSGEGPYIQHIGNYYYLFMSYGGFGPSDGYEMRVFRSAKPDGPYTDASGTSALYTKYQRNFGPNAATNKGMKLIGAMNNWGLMTVGECAQGHNSACQDDKGRTFLMCHTKFNLPLLEDGTRNLAHNVRAYQLYLNKEGWLVTAPFQFYGETTTDETLATTQPFSAADIEGDYHVIRHPYKLDHDNMAEATPGTIHLSADGKVTGDYTGTWAYTDEGKSYFRIKLGSYTYSGVIVEQTLEGSTAKALCFTTVCSTTGAQSGVPVWGYKLQPPYALSKSYQASTSTLFKNQSLNANKSLFPQQDENVVLSWTSSDPDVISATGKYNSPAVRTPVTMTARLDCGNYYWEGAYTYTALVPTALTGDPYTGIVAYYNFDEDPSANLFDDEQKAELGTANSSVTPKPTLEEDVDRFGNVVHQYFGAQQYNSYTRMPNPLKGLANLDGFTVSLWVKRLSDNRWDALWSFFNQTSSSAAGPRLFLTGNSYIGFNNNAGHWFDVNFPMENGDHPTGTYKEVDAMGENEWHLVTFTYSTENGYKLYLDRTAYTSSNMVYAGSEGKDSFDRSLVLNFVTSAAYFYLGLGSFWGSADACFDDLLIYNRELSSTDVRALSTVLNRVNSFDDGTIVGIESIEVPQSAEASSSPRGIYDLQGRKVAAPGKGLYIVNGKKVWFR